MIDNCQQVQSLLPVPMYHWLRLLTNHINLDIESRYTTNKFHLNLFSGLEVTAKS